MNPNGKRQTEAFLERLDHPMKAEILQVRRILTDIIAKWIGATSEG